MQIAFHIGAGHSDEDRLLKSLLKDAGPLLRNGVALPGPGKYRALIHKTVNALGGRAPALDTRDILLDAIVDDDKATRLVLSHDNFICVPNQIFGEGIFYRKLGTKVTSLREIFVEDELELFFSLRHPAIFLQKTLEHSKTSNLRDFMQGVQPTDIIWSDIIARIKQAAPNIPLTVWCNEDTPLIWGQIMRQIAWPNGSATFTGEHDMLARTLTKDGMAAYKKAISDTPPKTENARYDIIEKIWASHARPEMVEETINLPGISQQMIDDMSQSYDDDLANIAAMPGVNLITPTP